MPLTITDQETIALAQELADLTGQTPAAAVALALRDRLPDERERHAREERRRARLARPPEERLAEMRAIVKRFNKDLPPGPSAVEHGDLLYDENGLPK